jgi:hypothetical protein
MENNRNYLCVQRTVCKALSDLGLEVIKVAVGSPAKHLNTSYNIVGPRATLKSSGPISPEETSEPVLCTGALCLDKHRRYSHITVEKGR